jgi:hypothetical protein
MPAKEASFFDSSVECTDVLAQRRFVERVLLLRRGAAGARVRGEGGRRQRREERGGDAPRRGVVVCTSVRQTDLSGGQRSALSFSAPHTARSGAAAPASYAASTSASQSGAGARKPNPPGRRGRSAAVAAPTSAPSAATVPSAAPSAVSLRFRAMAGGATSRSMSREG